MRGMEKRRHLTCRYFFAAASSPMARHGCSRGCLFASEPAGM